MGLDRGIVVGPPRLPPAPSSPTGDPFTADGDMVMDCQVPGCGWHAFGPRNVMKQAYAEHYRQWHAAGGVTGVVLLNQPRQ